MASRLPTDDDMSAKLIFLAETDEAWAMSFALYRATEERLKVCKARNYLKATGKSIADREAEAITSPEYIDLLETLENALTERQLLSAQRERARLVIEVWRSLNANKRTTTGQAM